MTKLVIKDLPESIELDRQAMRSVHGGSRLSSARAGKASLKPVSKTLWGDLMRTRQSLLR